MEQSEKFIFVIVCAIPNRHYICSNMTEARWTKYTCNHEKMCPPVYHYGDFVATWGHEV